MRERRGENGFICQTACVFVCACVCVCVCVCERHSVSGRGGGGDIKYVDTKIGQKANSCMSACLTQTALIVRLSQRMNLSF